MQLNGRHMRLGHERNADPRLNRLKAWDMALVKNVAQVLEREWPGHFFRVTADHDQRMLRIELPPLIQTPHSYNIPIQKLWTDPGLTMVIHGAGELLERCQMPTSRWSSDDYRIAVQAQPLFANRRPGYQVPS